MEANHPFQTVQCTLEPHHTSHYFPPHSSSPYYTHYIPSLKHVLFFLFEPSRCPAFIALPCFAKIYVFSENSAAYLCSIIKILALRFALFDRAFLLYVHTRGSPPRRANALLAPCMPVITEDVLYVL